MELRRLHVSLDDELKVPTCYAKYFKKANSNAANDYKITIQTVKSKWNKVMTKTSWDSEKKIFPFNNLNELKTLIQKMCNASCSYKKDSKVVFEVQGSHINTLQSMFINHFDIDETNIFIVKPRIKFHPSFFINIKQNDDDHVEVSWKKVFSPKNFGKIFENQILQGWKLAYEKEIKSKTYKFILTGISKDKIVHFLNENYKMELYQILAGLENEDNTVPEITLCFDNPYNQIKNRFSDEDIYYKEMTSTIIDFYKYEMAVYAKKVIRENLAFKKIGVKDKKMNVWKTKFDSKKVFSIERIESGKVIKENDDVIIQYKNDDRKIKGYIYDITNGIVKLMIYLPFKTVPPGYVNEMNEEEEEEDNEEVENEEVEFEYEKENEEEDKHDDKDVNDFDFDDDDFEDFELINDELDDENDEQQFGDYSIRIIPSKINFQRSAMALLSFKDMEASPIKTIIENENGCLSTKEEKNEIKEIESFSINLKNSKYITDENRNNPKFMKYLEINPTQSQINCIKMILNNPVSLIQGPPGCGKTASISLFVYHLLKQKDFSEDKKRILLCAYSNQAVENIVKFVSPIVQALGKNLIWITKNTKMFENKSEFENATEEEKNLIIYKIMKRNTSEAHIYQIYQQQKWEHDMKVKNAKSRAKMKKEEPPKIPNFPREKINEMKRILTLFEANMISEADVVCCTLSTSAKHNLACFHFDTVFIDEASQATEVVSIIPLIHRPKNLVLLGDQKQLDAYVDDVLKKKHPKTTQSLYIRLLEKGIPSEMLNVQFRMHPLIAQFPSEEFYDGMILNADGIEQQTCIKLQSIPTPIIFIDVERGKEKRRNNDKSYFNYEEADAVAKIVNNFIINNIQGYEIGIITPYFAQANLIRSKIPENFNGIKISSVDNFQGSERDFIILSLVRTNKNGNFGFVSDQRRINVALTRARKGIIIIGNFDSIESSCKPENEFLRDLCHFYDGNLAVAKDYEIPRLDHLIEQPKSKKLKIDTKK